jgi:glucose-6-phosphate dehydrogenase assembly protein OpcA
MLQLLSLIAMEPPHSLESDVVRDEKLEVLRSLRPITGEQVDRQVVRAQYSAGFDVGKPVPGYRQEQGVDPSSTTETYVALQIFIDNWRWAGVPFFMRTGKRLPKRASEISVHLKEVPPILFNANPNGPLDPNVLSIRIQPDEGFALGISSKIPGPRVRVYPVQMDFHYGSTFGGTSPEAYERLLLDVMVGDSTLFMRRDAVEAAWRWVMPILERWGSQRAVRISESDRLDALVEGLPLEDVVARHPSRIVLIAHERRRIECQPIATGVGVLTFGPPQARYGIEEIAVLSSCADASLPSILLRVLRGDVPTSVWWAEDLSEVPPVPSLIAMGRQLVYDSSAWRDVRRGVLALAPVIRDRRCDCADLNWRRLVPVRQAVVHAVESMGDGDLRHGAVRIAHSAGEASLAWLLAGWLAARLQWPDAAPLTVEETRQSHDVLTLTCGAGGELRLTLTRQHVLVRRRGQPSFTVAVPREGAADAIAAELRSLAYDACLHDALAALIRRFSATSP